MKEEMESCINLETLTLCECDLVNLDNLPELPKLRELDLSSNLIPDAELKKLLQYRKL